jgi:hypothetical protein
VAHDDESCAIQEVPRVLSIPVRMDILDRSTDASKGARIVSERSAIEWTDATWNPVRGCTKVSPGCQHCYAETFAERFRGVPGHPFEQGFDLRLGSSGARKVSTRAGALLLQAVGRRDEGESWPIVGRPNMGRDAATRRRR